jgi:hypothetical protein
MNRLIACMIGGAVHQTFGGNATTAHIISTDLSQIYVAATWVGNRGTCHRSRRRSRPLASGAQSSPSAREAPRRGSRVRETSQPGAVAGFMAEGGR